MDVVIERWGAGTAPGFEALRAESAVEGFGRAFAFWDAMGFRRVGHATRTHEKARA